MARPARLIALAVCVTLLGACTSGSSDDASSPAADVSTCEELADRAANLVVDVVDHASAGAAGIPLGGIEATHPDQIDVWDVIRALASNDSELKERLEALEAARQEAECDSGWAHAAVEGRAEARAAALREDVDADDVERQEYIAVNLLAVLAANLAPPPERFEVPDGFPPEFPVHPDAELATTESGDDGSVMVTWAIEGASYDAVSDFYSEHLQELRFGGWSAPSGSESRNGVAEARTRLDVEGYGFTGTVVIDATDDGTVTVTATLSPVAAGADR